MMELQTYSAFMGEPSGSPFCTKAMCLLEMGKFDWKPVFIADPSKAPKKKLPVLIDGEKIIADSDQIRDYLEGVKGAKYDQGLNDRDIATSRLLIRTLEEHLYFAGMYERWMIEENWKHVKPLYFSSLPFPLNKVIPNMVRKSVKAQTIAQGMGRHTLDEQFDRTRKDVDAVNAILGDKPFLFGDEPTSADATAVPFLRASLVNPHRSKLCEHIASQKKLVAYLDRGKDTLYPKL